jgi:hypothetical protein
MRQRIDGRNFVNPCWWLSAVIQAHCASGADGRSWWDRWPLIKHHMAVRYWANWTAALDGRCWPCLAMIKFLECKPAPGRGGGNRRTLSTPGSTRH